MPESAPPTLDVQAHMGLASMQMTLSYACGLSEATMLVARKVQTVARC